MVNRKIKWLLALAAVVGAFLFGVFVSRSGNPFQFGCLAMQIRNYPVAIEQFNRASDLPKLHPRKDVLFARGQAYRHNKQYELAARDFRELRATFDRPQIAMLISHCYLMLGNHAAAEFELFAKGGKSQRVLHNRTYLQRISRKGRECIDFYKESHIKPRTQQEWHLTLLVVSKAIDEGDDEFVDKHADTTMKQLEKLLLANSWQEPRVFHDMAVVYSQLKMPDEAETHLKTALMLGWPKHMVSGNHFSELTEEPWYQKMPDNAGNVPRTEAETIMFPPTDAYRLDQL